MEAIANDTRVENEPQLPEDIWEFCYNASSTNVSRSEVSPVFGVEGIGLSSHARSIIHNDKKLAIIDMNFFMKLN